MFEKTTGPCGNSYTMVWRFVISFTYGWRHLKRSTKKNIWAKVILSICVVFLIPPSPMPLQNDRFPSKHLQDGLELRFSSSFPFFLFSKIQLKTVQNYLGPWHPSCVFLPK
jgi:hypothetical protein